LSKSFFFPQTFFSQSNFAKEPTNPTLLLSLTDEGNQQQIFSKTKDLLNTSFLGGRSVKFSTSQFFQPFTQTLRKNVIDSEKILLNEQSPRYYTNMNILKPNLNLSGSESLTKSNNLVNKKNLITSNLVNGGRTNSILIYKLLTNSFFDSSNTSSTLSSKPEINSYDYAPSKVKIPLTSFLKNDEKNFLHYQNNL